MPKEIPPEPGKKAWIKDKSPYPLPEPWRDKQQVLVLKVDGNDVTVRELHGEREVVLATSYIDSGWLFATRRGGTMHESHPQVLEALKKCIVDGMSSPHEATRTEIRRWAWVLQRNGVDVEMPPEIRTRVAEPGEGLVRPKARLDTAGGTYEPEDLRPSETVPRRA